MVVLFSHKRKILCTMAAAFVWRCLAFLTFRTKNKHLVQPERRHI